MLDKQHISQRFVIIDILDILLNIDIYLMMIMFLNIAIYNTMKIIFDINILYNIDIITINNYMYIEKVLIYFISILQLLLGL